jgi:hypothetical protein
VDKSLTTTIERENSQAHVDSDAHAGIGGTRDESKNAGQTAGDASAHAWGLSFAYEMFDDGKSSP